MCLTANDCKRNGDCKIGEEGRQQCVSPAAEGTPCNQQFGRLPGESGAHVHSAGRRVRVPPRRAVRPAGRAQPGRGLLR